MFYFFKNKVCEHLTEAFSFQQIADKILFPASLKPKMSPFSLLISCDSNCIKEDGLTRQGNLLWMSVSLIGLRRNQLLHLDRYRENFPGKMMYSLSQNPLQRPRTDDKDLQWPTLTRQMDLWLRAQPKKWLPLTNTNIIYRYIIYVWRPEVWEEKTHGDTCWVPAFAWVSHPFLGKCCSQSSPSPRKFLL